MNINCENCRASYRLDVAMFKGARGMVVRCRRCGKSIIVLKPEEIASDMSVLDRVASEGDRSGSGSTDPAVSPAKEEYSPPQEVEQVPSVEEQARISQKKREEVKYSILEREPDPPVEEQDRISQKKREEVKYSILEGELDPPVEEQARISQKDREEEEYSILEGELDPPVQEQARISQKGREEEEYSFVEVGKKSPLGPVPPNAFTVLYPLLPKSPPRDLRRRTFKWSSIIGFSFLFIFLVG